MKLNKRHQRGGLEINMTPMIDVTFLLLIFFMTVNQVSKANRENIPLPPAKGSQDQTEGPLVINIVNPEGQIKVSGNEVTLVQLATIVGAERAKVGNDSSRLKVLVRAHRDGPCRTVNAVVKLLERFEVRGVRVSVES
jgi:biopolymer transport protein ExbD